MFRFFRVSLTFLRVTTLGVALCRKCRLSLSQPVKVFAFYGGFLPPTGPLWTGTPTLQPPSRIFWLFLTNKSLSFACGNVRVVKRGHSTTRWFGARRIKAHQILEILCKSTLFRKATFPLVRKRLILVEYQLGRV